MPARAAGAFDDWLRRSGLELSCVSAEVRVWLALLARELARCARVLVLLNRALGCEPGSGLSAPLGALCNPSEGVLCRSVLVDAARDWAGCGRDRELLRVREPGAGACAGFPLACPGARVLRRDA